MGEWVEVAISEIAMIRHQMNANLRLHSNGLLNECALPPSLSQCNLRLLKIVERVKRHNVDGRYVSQQ